MTEESVHQAKDSLCLSGVEQIETAWRAINITGNAPNIAPLLNAMVELIHTSPNPAFRTSAGLYLEGGSAGAMKQEIIDSLKTVTDTLDKESDTVKAARGLLAILVK